MGDMHPNQLISLNSLRMAVERRRRGHLAGRAWSPARDRDLDRIACDLMVMSQSGCGPVRHR